MLFLHHGCTPCNSETLCESQSSDTSVEKEKSYIQVTSVIWKIYSCKTLLPDVNPCCFSRLRDNYFKMEKCRRNIVTSHFHHQQKTFMESCRSSHTCGLRYINHSNCSGFFWSSAIQNGVRIDLNIRYIQSDPWQSVINMLPSECCSSEQFLHVKCAASSYSMCESVVWCED